MGGMAQKEDISLSNNAFLDIYLSMSKSDFTIPVSDHFLLILPWKFISFFKSNLEFKSKFLIHFLF